MRYLLVPLLFAAVGLRLPAAAGLPARPGRAVVAGASKRIAGLELAQFHFKPYALTDVTVGCGKSEPQDAMFQCLIQFDWQDPNANGTRSVCANAWQWDGTSRGPGARNTYNTDYQPCRIMTTTGGGDGDGDGDGELFQFEFLNMADISRFTLQLSHIFTDYNDFPQPTTANLFGLANVTLSAASADATSITYTTAGPVNAQIMGAVI
ncbi:hypothetical protein GGR56DRAFT_687744 [Xylariaceae sp. FL0804]|nr:hypothetical protein GGR56DRAFT_687744 [Xylariaceae sp. FL0804]